MTKHIIITSDRKKSNISVYSQEPAVVVTADREDMNSLRTLSEANQAGVYILVGENRRYVGQASGKVYDRLVKHDKQKEWWTKIIFFGREDGHLDKSQTDYLEQKLIQEFENSGFDLENGTIGNTSYIDKTSKIRADNVWYTTHEILEEVANINLFQMDSIRELNETENSSKKKFVIIDNNGNKFSDKSARANYIHLVKHYLTDSNYQDAVLRLVVKEKPTSRALLGAQKSILPSGRATTVELLPNIFLYTHFSTEARRKAIQKFANQIGIKIDILW
ncbi:GIY-YIG nuclease family protein [Enterococcus hulanensis]|uniref:GIY-YIG nuclease family protein n=1 Tax=Enterococcus hulanensis TaxID=2559929 RepID=UPI001A8EC745|nr:GIY-YIG nuclease family protein [Enterococcus hulanensis]MBO0457749.1 GIY-YIG nuclease family protein [Enterococcus hulanensis]